MSKTHRRRQPKKSKTLKHKRFSMKGGAVYKIPGIPAKYEDFKAGWKINYLGSHGVMNGNVFKVPENTYILNMSTAGKSCEKCIFSLENIVYSVPRKDMLAIIHKGLHSGKFLDLISSYKITKRLNAVYSGIESSAAQSSLSFYEPGDIITDINLFMYEQTPPYFLMGLYNVPIDPTLNTKIKAKNKARNFEYDEEEENYEIVGPGPTEAQIKDDNRELFLNKSNLLTDELTRIYAGTPTNGVPHFTLHDIVFNHLPRVDAISPDQKRILIVGACRTTSNPSNMIRARRYSIAARGIGEPPAAPVDRAAGGAGAAAPVELLNLSVLQSYVDRLRKAKVVPHSISLLEYYISTLNANQVLPMKALQIALTNVYLETSKAGLISDELAKLLNLNNREILNDYLLEVMPSAAASGGAGSGP